MKDAQASWGIEASRLSGKLTLAEAKQACDAYRPTESEMIQWRGAQTGGRETRRESPRVSKQTSRSLKKILRRSTRSGTGR